MYHAPLSVFKLCSLSDIYVAFMSRGTSLSMSLRDRADIHLALLN